MRVEDADLGADTAALLALNNAAVPAVNTLTVEAFQALAALGRVRVVRGDGGTVDGFVLTLPSGTDYASLNYQWFDKRYASFLYVDRVVVDPRAQGGGIGRLLYEDTIARARAEGFERVCSEVNVDPPNPQSMAFHARLGFVPVFERLNPAEGKTVAMMVHGLAATAA